MTNLRRWTSIFLCGTLLGAASCSDANAPEDVDPAVVASGMAGLTSAFSGNLAFQSLRELSAQFTFPAAGAALSATLPPPPGGAPLVTLTPAQRRALLQLSLHGGSGSLAIFPVDVLGGTFVWDVAQDRYVRSLTATGAPSNGVRFELYLVDLETHLPQEPLMNVGYVDLTDLSTAQADRLGVLVKYGTQTIASYTVTAAVSTSSVALGADGYLAGADGTARLDFVLATTISSSGFTLDYDLAGSNGFSASLVVTVNLVGNTSSLAWRISQGGNSIEVTGTSTATAVNCHIKFNGVMVATASGDPDAPTITGALGHTFTAEELDDLGDVFEGFFELIDQIDGVFSPAGLVF